MENSTQDTDNSMSFAEMFNQQSAGPLQLEPGQQIEATVVRITKENIFLDLGGKSEGLMATAEVLNADGEIAVKEKDRIKVYFLVARNNEMLFTVKLSGSKAAYTHLEDAFRNEIPVDGVIEKEIKGGFEVKIGGSARGFCPFSQVDLRRAGDPAEYIGKSWSFQIVEYRERGRNIILSRRRLLEREREIMKEELQGKLQEGDALTGTITSIRDFGAFVDVGGIEGLIPISEIGWGRVEDIHQILIVGQEVEVVALKLDWENDRYSFSLKQAMSNPWETVPSKYPVGSTFVGKVVRLAQFGAFVSLEPGIDGLVHISKLGGGRRINHPREVLAEGQALEVQIDSCDLDEKRLSLSLPVNDEDDPEKQEKEEVQQYLSKSREKKQDNSMGTLGDLLKGKMR